MNPENKILNIIESEGYIHLDDFMKTSLSELKTSYYRFNKPLGKSGDFITAPEISQLYGEIIGLYIADYIQKMSYKDFNLIELGPGKGTLMNDIARILSKIFKNSINYKINFIEINYEYKKNLNSLFDECFIHENVDNLPGGNSIIIANEYFDTFPIIQAIKVNDKLFETIIRSESGKLVFDRKEIRKEFSFLFNNTDLIENEVIEKSPAANLIFEESVKHIKKNNGMMIVADYGYNHNTEGNTLQSIKDNKKTNFFDNIANQDLTSQVNFQSLMNILDKNEIKDRSFHTQREFLFLNGINLRAEQLIKANKKKEESILNQVSRLTDIDKMGNLFKFLIFSI